MTTLHSRRYQELLERLRAARKGAGLTQVQVAERLGRPQSWVSKSENGERRLDVLELDEFARLYGRTVTDFIPR